MPWWARLMVATGVLMVVVFLGGVLGVRWYLGSEGFRAQVEREMGKSIKGQAKVQGLRWGGLAARVDRVKARSRVGEWSASALEAEVSLAKFWDGVWVIPEVRIARMEGEWLEDGELLESSEKKGVRGKGKLSGGFLPTQAWVERVVVDQWEGVARLQSGLRWRWIGVRAEGKREGKGLVFDLKGGRFETPWTVCSKADLQKAKVRKTGGSWHLESSDWEVWEDGRLSVSATQDAGGWSGEGDFSDVHLANLLPEKWWKVVKGEAMGSYEFDRIGAEGAEVRGRVEIADGVLSNVPILERLAAYGGTARFQKLIFDEASAEVTWREGQWELRDLVLEHKGLVKVVGAVDLRGEEIEGRLRVGVPQGLLAHLPGAEEKVFLPGEGGLLWAPVRVTGSWRKPQEDLSERMIRAAGERMFELIPNTGQWALRFGGEAMDQGTALLWQKQGVILENGVNAAEDVIEQGTDVIGEGLQIGGGLLNGILGGGAKEGEE